jgi:hypothetical protein
MRINFKQKRERSQIDPCLLMSLLYNPHTQTFECGKQLISTLFK